MRPRGVRLFRPTIELRTLLLPFVCGTQPPRFPSPPGGYFCFRAGSFRGEILAELQAKLSRCEERFEDSRLRDWGFE